MVNPSWGRCIHVEARGLVANLGRLVLDSVDFFSPSCVRYAAPVLHGCPSASFLLLFLYMYTAEYFFTD